MFLWELNSRNPQNSNIVKVNVKLLRYSYGSRWRRVVSMSAGPFYPRERGPVIYWIRG
jgi:hypothetical protein